MRGGRGPHCFQSDRALAKWREWEREQRAKRLLEAGVEGSVDELAEQLELERCPRVVEPSFETRLLEPLAFARVNHSPLVDALARAAVARYDSDDEGLEAIERVENAMRSRDVREALEWLRAREAREARDRAEAERSKRRTGGRG